MCNNNRDTALLCCTVQWNIFPSKMFIFVPYSSSDPVEVRKYEEVYSNVGLLDETGKIWN